VSTIDLATYSYNLELSDKSFTSGMQNAERSVDGFQGKASGLTSFLKTSVVAGIAAVGVALAGVAVKGVKDFVGFEQQMNEVFTLLPDISEKAMSDMTEQVKDFSKEFGTLPNEVVPALYQSISAGVPEDNVFSFLETAQKAAVGGVTELETAVDGISSVINAYGTDVLDATQASDLMFTAVKLGKTDFAQLSQSLYNVIPTASSLGVEFGDVTAALAAMTAQGTPTSVATTQLRQLFVELSKEGGKASQTFQELSGKSFKDFIDEGNNVQDALQLMEQYSIQSNLGINDLFGSVEAGNSALALTGKGTDVFANNLVEMAESAGATDRAYETMERGIGRSFNKIKANLATMVLDVGGKLAPTVAEMADWVVVNMPIIQSTVEGALNFVGQVISVVIDLLKILINGLISLYENNKEIFDGIVSIISTAFDTIMGLFGLVTALLKGDWTAFGEELNNITQNVFKLIEDIFDLGFKVITTILLNAVTSFKTLGTNIMNALLNSFKAIWNLITTWFSQAIGGLLTWFKELYKSFYNVGSDIFTAIWDGIRSVWENLSSWITEKVNWLQDKLSFWRSSQSEMSSADDNDGNNPAYAQGMPFVPETGLALLHAGEMVVPAQYNPYNPANKSGRSEALYTSGESFNIYGNININKVDNLEQFTRQLKQRARLV